MQFDEALKITGIIDETHDVKTFRLEKKSIDFIPGQYILVSLPDFEDIKDEDRPFTFSCSPSKDYVEITVKKFGKITTIMHEQLKVGNSLRLVGPFGESLNFDKSTKGNIVFIAGGSGITPFKSIIDYIIEKQLPNKVFLFFSNRTQADIIYRDYWEQVKQKVKVINALSNEEPKGWDGELGRIDKEMIQKYISGPKDYLYYICGPPPMTIAMKDMLRELGVPDSRSRIENWQLPGKHD